jgi:hypothetical protein
MDYIISLLPYVVWLAACAVAVVFLFAPRRGVKPMLDTRFPREIEHTLGIASENKLEQNQANSRRR